jgi:hypothetical protein
MSNLEKKSSNPDLNIKSIIIINGKWDYSLLCHLIIIISDQHSTIKNKRAQVSD